MTDLQHQQTFKQQPSDAYLEAWRAHIERTGYPETFVGVSTSRPTQLDNIVLLSEEIRVPIVHRRDEDAGGVPCPFCSPGKPKFFRGRMAFFPDEQAVRFIGPRCAQTHFGDNYATADTVYARQQRCRQYLQLWRDIDERRSEIERLLVQCEPIADALEEVRDRIEKQAPGLCTFLQRELAQTDGELTVMQNLGGKDAAGQPVWQRTIIGSAAGLTYLQTAVRPLRMIRNARAALEKSTIPMPAWEASTPEHWATNDILRLGRGTASALRKLPDAVQVLRDGQAFLTKKNLALIHRWGNRPQTPFSKFDMKRTERQLEFKIKAWSGDYYASPLAASPDLAGSLPLPSSTTLRWLGGLSA